MGRLPFGATEKKKNLVRFGSYQIGFVSLVRTILVKTENVKRRRVSGKQRRIWEAQNHRVAREIKERTITKSSDRQKEKEKNQLRNEKSQLGEIYLNLLVDVATSSSP